MSAWKEELRSTLRLAAPVVTVQVGLFAMNCVDTVMVGHMAAGDGGTGALAAVGVGAFYHWICIVWWFGCLMALDPVVSQAVGARDSEGAARGLQRGLILAAAMAVPAMLAAIPAPDALRLLGQQETVVPRAAVYARINAAGALPFLVFVVVRQMLQAHDRLRGLVAVIVAANAVNVLANWALIFGHLGCPPLGVAGSAWATVISRWLMAAGLVLLEWPALRPALRPWRKETLALQPILRMLRLGAPIGTQYLLEFGIFGLALVMIGWIGVLPQEGHQIAINLASFSFTFPWGISAAAAVRVGWAVGRGDPAAARRAAASSLALGVGVMAAFALVFLVAPRALASIYSPEVPVIAMAALLIPLAGVFQVFDVLQVVSIGVLRGLGDTLTPALVNILGFWVLGLPLGWVLAFPLGLGASGVWWGLVAGLVAVSLLLLLRVRSRLRGPLARLDIDETSVRCQARD